MQRRTANSPGLDLVDSTYLCWSSLREVLERELLSRIAGPAVTSQTLRILKFLARVEPQTIGAIAHFLGVSEAAASKTVDKMVHANWLRRAQSIPDRRVWTVCLTRASLALLRRYDQALAKELSSLFRHCQPDELRRSSAMLDRIAVQIVQNSRREPRPCMRCGIYFRDGCPLRMLAQTECGYSRGARGQIVMKATHARKRDHSAKRKPASCRDKSRSRAARPVRGKRLFDVQGEAVGREPWN